MVLRARVHWPAATVAVQLSTPSLTETLPVGVPVPGATGATAYWTVTAFPTSDGSGPSELIAVVVLAGPTVCASAADVLALKRESPAYVAVSDLAPAVANVRVQWPVATVAVHETEPSLTVT